MAAALKLQVALMKEAAEKDKERINSFEAHIRLTENRYAMYWAARVSNMFDADHNDPRYSDYRPLGARSDNAPTPPSSGSGAPSSSGGNSLATQAAASSSSSNTPSPSEGRASARSPRR